MKKTLVLLTLIVALMVMVVGASANSTARLRVNIPFAFYIDKELLPPGQYILEMRPITPHSATASSVVVCNEDGALTAWTPAMPGAAIRRESNDHAHFNKYGDKYFLSKVECAGYEADLRMTKAEKEYWVKATKAQDATVVGQ